MRSFAVTELMRLHTRKSTMSKFDQSRMVEECAEYQEYLEQWEDDDLLLEEMAEYYLEQGNLELLGLCNG